MSNYLPSVEQLTQDILMLQIKIKNRQLVFERNIDMKYGKGVTQLIREEMVTALADPNNTLSYEELMYYTINRYK